MPEDLPDRCPECMGDKQPCPACSAKGDPPRVVPQQEKGITESIDQPVGDQSQIPLW